MNRPNHRSSSSSSSSSRRTRAGSTASTMHTDSVTTGYADSDGGDDNGDRTVIPIPAAPSPSPQQQSFCRQRASSAVIPATTTTVSNSNSNSRTHSGRNNTHFLRPRSVTHDAAVVGTTSTASRFAAETLRIQQQHQQQQRKADTPYSDQPRRGWEHVNWSLNNDSSSDEEDDSCASSDQSVGSSSGSSGAATQRRGRGLRRHSSEPSFDSMVAAVSQEQQHQQQQQRLPSDASTSVLAAASAPPSIAVLTRRGDDSNKALFDESRSSDDEEAGVVDIEIFSRREQLRLEREYYSENDEDGSNSTAGSHNHYVDIRWKTTAAPPSTSSGNGRAAVFLNRRVRLRWTPFRALALLFCVTAYTIFGLHSPAETIEVQKTKYLSQMKHHQHDHDHHQRQIPTADLDVVDDEEERRPVLRGSLRQGEDSESLPQQQGQVLAELGPQQPRPYQDQDGGVVVMEEEGTDAANDNNRESNARDSSAMGVPRFQSTTSNANINKRGQFRLAHAVNAPDRSLTFKARAGSSGSPGASGSDDGLRRFYQQDGFRDSRASSPALLRCYVAVLSAVAVWAVRESKRRGRTVCEM